MYETIHELFVKFGYVWKISGVLRTPTVEEIKEFASQILELMKQDEEISLYQSGRLIAKRDAGDRISLYLYMGDINEADFDEG